MASNVEPAARQLSSVVDNEEQQGRRTRTRIEDRRSEPEPIRQPIRQPILSPEMEDSGSEGGGSTEKPAGKQRSDELEDTPRTSMASEASSATENSQQEGMMAGVGGSGLRGVGGISNGSSGSGAGGATNNGGFSGNLSYLEQARNEGGRNSLVMSSGSGGEARFSASSSSSSSALLGTEVTTGGGRLSANTLMSPENLNPLLPILCPSLLIRRRQSDVSDPSRRSSSSSSSSSSSNSSSNNNMIESVLDPVEDAFDELEALVFEWLHRKYGAGFLDKRCSHYNKYLQIQYMKAQSVAESDFTQFRVLGRGGFGLVYGGMRNSTGQLYAMKTMDRRRVKLKSAMDLCWNERIILGRLNSPFIVCLKYAFVSRAELFLVMDLMLGGDLSFWLKQRRFTEEETAYHAGRIFLALKHMHENNIVYRDLKPENILMDDKGRTRISDLGLACSIKPGGGLRGTCGTVGYMAPEMLVSELSRSDR